MSVCRNIVGVAMIAGSVLVAAVAFADDGHAVSGRLTDQAGNPLRRVPVAVESMQGARLVEGFTGDMGEFCLADETLDEDEDLRVCLTAVAGPAACTAGAPNTVAGAIEAEDGSPLEDRNVVVETLEGEQIAAGRTGDEGVYCLKHEAIEPGHLYRVCVSPVEAEKMQGGLSGIAYGAENEPLRSAALIVRETDSEGEVIVEDRTSFEGKYCLVDEAIEAGVMYRLCVDSVATQASCAPGQVSVSGAMTHPNGYPMRDARIVIEDREGNELQQGATNEYGAYCITGDNLMSGTVYRACVDLTASCTCCCSCCCGALVIPLWPVAAIPASVVVYNEYFDEDERETGGMSPSR